MSALSCVAGGCCDNRPGWVYDAVTGTRRRAEPHPGQHGWPGHECRPRTVVAGYLCNGCRWMLGRLISEVPGLVVDLERAVTHNGQRPSSSSPTREGSPDFATGRKRLGALGQVAHDVAWWVQLTADGVRAVGRPSMEAARPVRAIVKGCAWLAKSQHVDWLAAQPAADETVAAWRTIQHEVRSAMDIPRDRARFQVGPCPEDCPGTVWAFIGTDNTDSVMACDADAAHAYEPKQWLRAGRRILNRKAGG